MKRLAAIFCLLLPSLYIPQAQSEFKAAAASSNITPKLGVSLDGIISKRSDAVDIHDELWARCIVLTDEKTTLAIAIVDSTSISREIHDAAKKRIETRTGIPPKHVCIAATHTHSTPRAVVNLVDQELHREYLEFITAKIADGICRAHRRLVAAEIGWGSFEEPRYVHNRRWHVTKPVASPLGGKLETAKMGLSPHLDKPTGPVDPEVFLVALRRKSDHQPIAVLANYGTHYVGGIPRDTVSADYFGVFARAITRKWKAEHLSPPFVGMLSNGTSGDVGIFELGKPRPKYALYEAMNLIANQIAERAIPVLDKMEFQSDLTIAATSAELALGVRKPSAERIEWAKKNQAPAQSRIRMSRPQVYAKEALILAGYPDKVTIPLQAFRIGRLAIAQSSCETFAKTGLAIKKESPFSGSTFTIELANGYAGYLPPPEQFKFGGYSTWPARSSFLEENAETRIREKIIELLGELDRN